MRYGDEEEKRRRERGGRRKKTRVNLGILEKFDGKNLTVLTKLAKMVMFVKYNNIEGRCHFVMTNQGSENFIVAYNFPPIYYSTNLFYHHIT